MHIFQKDEGHTLAASAEGDSSLDVGVERLTLRETPAGPATTPPHEARERTRTLKIVGYREREASGSS